MKALVICGLLAASFVSAQERKAPVENRETASPKEAEPKKKDAGKDSAKDPDDTVEAAELPAGHSYHGEAFNEGPRQKAYLMGGTSNVEFKISTASDEARKFFNQGIGQLHGFWYFEAERSFRQVAKLDPNCKMAYWGMAMANFENEKRAKGFFEKADALESELTEAEQDWYDGLKEFYTSDGDRKRRRERYVKSLERLVLKYPDDLEAKAFLVVRLWQFKGDLRIQSHVAIDALIRAVLAKNPMHPIHHYKIHLWDYEKSDEALRSAATCGQASPSIAHMWHMPGHIYSRLHRYEDAVWQQESSARTDHAHMMRDRVLPDQIHNYAHNNEWLIRNLIFIGRSDDAIALAKNMLELPRHPKLNTLSRRGRSSSFGRQRLFQVLETYELWDQLIELADTVYLEESTVEREQVKRLRKLGKAYFGKDSEADLKAQIAKLESRQAEKNDEISELEERARDQALLEGKNEKDLNKSVKRAGDGVRRSRRDVDSALEELQFYASLMAEDADAEKLLEDLEKVDGLSKIERSRLRFRLGDIETALEDAKSQVDSSENQVVPLANWVDLLARAEKMDEAKEAMTKLRDLSAYADIGTPPFQRLSNVVAAMGLEEDWRPEATILDDVGDRPKHSDLGPFRWQPYKAPDWSLSDARGEEYSLKKFKGRPVLVVFYLGFGCLHCVEQLKIFAPMQHIFAGDGIDMVAVSTEDKELVARSLESFSEDGEFPIPLLPDPKLELFKRYRAYDDFEEQPLHGTFLINGEGRVVWQDISYEPFSNVDFLIQEARRLLGKTAKTRTKL